MSTPSDNNYNHPLSTQITDTVAAISTAPGPGGIGVVRITGPGSLNVSRKIFTPSGGWKKSSPEPRVALVGRVHACGSPEDPIDQAVFLFFAAPASYTGEDTVELTMHGGPIIMSSVLREAVTAGSRLAEPGEFTRRAFLNGRLDLSQAEAVASLIYAATEGAMKVMFQQAEGAMGRQAKTIRSLLVESKVVIESAIDFPEEEDVADLDLEGVRKSLVSGLAILDQLLSTSRQGVALTAGISVTIIGTPNVGKSSLLNALLEEDRAIVHEVAGTTRDFVEGRIDIKGIPMRVVDTAGIREGAGTVEIEGILRTRRLMEQSDILLVVIDGARQVGEADQGIIKETGDMPRLIVVNKSDLEIKAELQADHVSVSARTGEGIELLKQAIHELYAGGAPELTSTDGVVTTMRQAEALSKTRDACARALRFLDGGHLEPELLAVDLDEALEGIGELTGEVTADEVLDEIFERFCIGK